MTQSQSTPKFSVGDRVRCLKNSAQPAFDLAVGALYTVSAIRPTGSIELVEGARRGWLNEPLAYAEGRFELANDARPPFPKDSRVVLAEDYGFYDEGDAATVVGFDPTQTQAMLRFDGGAVAALPVSVLKAAPKEFRVLLTSNGTQLLGLEFSSEGEAAEAAADLGYKSFTVVRMVRIADYKVEEIPATYELLREAA